MSNQFIIIIFLLLSIGLSSCIKVVMPENSVQEERTPNIFPDYNDVTIPANIAPLNFSIRENGESFIVHISSKNGNDIKIKSNDPEIEINIKKWHELLERNKGEQINFDVYCKNGEKWTHYNTIKNNIAMEDIDSYLSYRLINLQLVLWFEMGIYQRNLENFDESPIVLSKSINGGCINCHSLSRNNPDKFMFHVRNKFPGTLIYNDGKIEKIETSTEQTKRSAGYGSWSPDGRHIAYSVNYIVQNFHIFKDQSNEVSDRFSDLIVYDTETNILTTSPKVRTSSRENLPEWSADGKSIYFLSADEAINDSIKVVSKYSLLNIPYDAEKNIWGEVDTVLSSNETGKSITFPRTSPDGKYLAFCMIDYGYFSIHHKGSDLYLLNLENGDYKPIDIINSSETDSYHSWSTNSRWLIFSSRRIDGVHTRTFIAYLDEDGNFHKPFVVPQKDPEKYTHYLYHYNRPELMTGKIKISPQQIRDAVRKDAVPVEFDPTISIDALTGASDIAE